MAKILQADRPRLEPLVAELQTFVAEIAHEAAAGDVDARRWLVSAFPGHDRIFEQVWNRPVKQAESGRNLKKPETA